MGLKVDNQTIYNFNNNVGKYFNLDIGEPIRNNDYELLKNEIYKLNIDSEEKANIINVINKLSITKSLKEKRDLTNEIEKFKRIYKL